MKIKEYKMNRLPFMKKAYTVYVDRGSLISVFKQSKGVLKSHNLISVQYVLFLNCLTNSKLKQKSL